MTSRHSECWFHIWSTHGEKVKANVKNYKLRALINVFWYADYNKNSEKNVNSYLTLNFEGQSMKLDIAFETYVYQFSSENMHFHCLTINNNFEDQRSNQDFFLIFFLNLVH